MQRVWNVDLLDPAVRRVQRFTHATANLVDPDRDQVALHAERVDLIKDALLCRLGEGLMISPGGGDPVSNL